MSTHVSFTHTVQQEEGDKKSHDVYSYINIVYTFWRWLPSFLHGGTGRKGSWSLSEE